MRRNRSLAVLALLLGGVPCHVSASTAYTRVGEANEFRNKGDSISFSLSFAPNAQQAGSVPVSMPQPGSGANWNSRDASRQFVFQATASGGGAYVGDTATTSAPVLPDGSTWSGTYLATPIKTGSPVTARFYTGPTSGVLMESRAVSMLWGSLSADDNFSVGTKNGISTGSISILGSDVLAAASAMGMGNLSGLSVYLTVNAISSSNLTFMAAYSGGATAMEFVPLEFSTASIASSSVTIPASGSGDGEPAEAPAPVLGTTSAGGLIALGLLGLLRPRRRRAATVA